MMAMNPRNILSLLRQSFDEPQYDIESVITVEERSFARQLEDLIKDAVQANLFLESHSTLCFHDDEENQDALLVEEDFDEDFVESVKDNQRVKVICIDLEYKQKAVAFWRSGKERCRKFKQVQHRFKHVKCERMLYKWEQQIAEGGGRLNKLQRISESVLQHFQDASKKCIAIHDLDLKRWALRARNEVGLSQTLFRASTKWIYNFKAIHHIVSRKINKFVTTAQLTNKEELVGKADKFVSSVCREILFCGKDNIYNSDQSGFNFESHAGRTLSFQGTMKVECLAQSLNSMTHSYTLQPLISADGILKSPLLIVLQEVNGCFGPIVERNLYRAENIFVQAST